MHIAPIITDRLLLIPIDYPTATALLHRDQSILTNMGLKPTELWPDQEALDTLPKSIRNLKLAGESTGFESWMVVLRSTKTVIGDAGFKGGPGTTGSVDLGYAIIVQEQRKGYGTEVAQALIAWAFAQPQVNRVTASCLLTNTESAGILKKVGMYKTYQDEHMQYWEIIKEPVSS